MVKVSPWFKWHIQSQILLSWIHYNAILSYFELCRMVSAQGMVLVIYRSFSFAYPLFASLKMSGMSITYPGYWYLPSPDKIPTTSKSKFYPIILEKVFPFKNSKYSKVVPAKEYGVSSYKKMMKREKKKRAHGSHRTCRAFHERSPSTHSTSGQAHARSGNDSTTSTRRSGGLSARKSRGFWMQASSRRCTTPSG